jgi:two-component system NtrC family sensor kinase
LNALLAPDRSLIVLTPDDDTTTVAYAAGDPQPRPDNPLIQLVTRSGPHLISTDVTQQLNVLGITLDDPPASWLGCPMTTATTWGAISLGAHTPGRYGPEDLEIVATVAGEAAIALDNVHLVTLLSRGKREWELTVDAIPQAICVVDGNHAVRRANRAFGALADVPLTEITGRPLIGLVPPAWADPIARALSHAEGESVELEGAGRLFTMSVLPLAQAGDGAAVLIFDDQTEKRRLQDQLIQSEKMSAIGQLIAGVAHDLNNPLASVVGFADYLAEQSDKAPPEMVEPLRAIRQEAERAANIVKNLLTFARKQEHERRVLPVKQILTSTLLLLKNQLMAGRIEASLEVEDALPDVAADPIQMQQVFINLVSNAAQAIEGSGVGGRIEIHAVPWLDGVAVVVEDDGPGVPPDMHEKVFEPFFTTKPPGEGTGLGLSICQGIVKEHGGRLSLTAGSQRGAAFRVELPGAKPVEVDSPSPAAETGPLDILVIDDEPHIQHYMWATLESWGHRVVLASNGDDGLAQIKQGPFDVVITDLRMPQLGGREMYQLLVQEYPEVAQRVVFITGDTVRGDTLAFLESAGRPYLRKPFSLAELRGVLAAAVSKR